MCIINNKENEYFGNKICRGKEEVKKHHDYPRKNLVQSTSLRRENLHIMIKFVGLGDLKSFYPEHGFSRPA